MFKNVGFFGFFDTCFPGTFFLPIFTSKTTKGSIWNPSQKCPQFCSHSEPFQDPGGGAAQEPPTHSPTARGGGDPGSGSLLWQTMFRHFVPKTDLTGGGARTAHPSLWSLSRKCPKPIFQKEFGHTSPRGGEFFF